MAAIASLDDTPSSELAVEYNFGSSKPQTVNVTLIASTQPQPSILPSFGLPEGVACPRPVRTMFLQ